MVTMKIEGKNKSLICFYRESDDDWFYAINAIEMNRQEFNDSLARLQKNDWFTDYLRNQFISECEKWLNQY